ncbi:ABC transporter permease [Natronomonas salsuginis]|uniref:ABC transporter permease n=1 Tax=Natronomonas salsuginis TaxID=2217661 RepID=A0A4U5JFX1_9EURY|nr:ABC transporter permease [Natronomonas salsuginis]TKR24949.1 ABC transporter permease [Natronomonas salsuginis]
MTRVPALFVARRNLSRNRLRSALAALGILVGVVAIASLGIFGNVLAVGADDALGDIGTQVIVTPNADAGIGSIDERTVTEIERVTTEGTVVPLRTDGGLVRRGGQSAAATIYGIENPNSIYTAADGRLPDRHRQGAIVGADLAVSLDARVGDNVDVAGETYRVIAVLEPIEAFTPVSPNDAVMLPEDAVGGDGYQQVVIQTETGAAATSSAAAIEATVNDREAVVEVFELSSILEEIDAFFSLLSAFLVGLGGISLFVAGVSILNVMLMSAVERREEIGVLRAVGVSRRSVLRTMLFEAALLGVVGALGGVFVTAFLVAGLYLATPVELWIVLDPTNALYLVGAFAFGILISVVSGLYPAWKAANERPVDALRG